MKEAKPLYKAETDITGRYFGYPEEELTLRKIFGEYPFNREEIKKAGAKKASKTAARRKGGGTEDKKAPARTAKKRIASTAEKPEAKSKKRKGYIKDTKNYAPKRASQKPSARKGVKK